MIDDMYALTELTGELGKSTPELCVHMCGYVGGGGCRCVLVCVQA